MNRKPVEIDGNMLRAIFARPKPSDTRPLLVRLLASIRPVVRVGRKGLSFVGVRGGAEF
jgi:hypothetical protein